MPQQTPRLRYFGPGHLAAASIFGGVGACCWLMAHNEALRPHGPWWPWQPIAILFVTCEAIAHVVMWFGVIASEWLAVTWLVPLLALCIIAVRRYRGYSSRTRPAGVVEAVQVGWGFCAVRVGLALGFGVLVYVFALAE